MYSKLQKFISFFLIFFLLFSFTFRVPFFGLLSNTFAKETEFYNIVSIIVEEDIYPSIKNEIERYSKDIQGVLEKTKVIILPTPNTATSFNIASLNEGLYYEGLKSLKPSASFESKLIGTILIGDLPIPLVFKKANSMRSIVPYTDFEDKLYVWDNENNRYLFSDDNQNGLKAEIWHGVINPNKGNKGANILSIKDYFSKNHDFYKGKGNFKTSSGVLNGDNSKGIPNNYEPFVFYFDQIRESKSIIYDNYISYNQYLENKEDLAYNRFSNEFANKLKNGVTNNSSKEIGDMIKDINPNFISSTGGGINLTNSPDIQSRHVIKKYAKKMLEIFNPSTLGEFKKNVHNAGRYNGKNKKVNVDSPSFIISTLDTVNTEVIKSINNELEEQIDNLVKSGLSRKIAIPTVISIQQGCGKKYTNILYGKQASKITNASECSIYRGSTKNGGTLVEANRALNTKLSEADGKKCGKEIGIDITTGKITKGIRGYWGSNTPLNLAGYTTSADLKIGPHDLNRSIVPLFDIAGSKKITNPNLIPDPRNCFKNNHILTKKRTHDNVKGKCVFSYIVPINGQKAKNWDCNTKNIRYNFPKSFDYNYNNPSGKIFLDGTLVKTKNNPVGVQNKYYYKKITSYIFHKSPNADELSSQINAMTSPTLPIDKDRYVDFIGAKGNYARIDYPQLFKINNTKEKLDLTVIKSKIKAYLDTKSSEVNNVINISNPSSLHGKNKQIYNLLKVGTFPTNNVDFYDYLSKKANKDYVINGETKTASYIDTLAFAIYWNNLKSISAKYKFVFENYLNDEIGGNLHNFHLVKNKKLYEIAYLGAPGDARSMYVKLDPEGKAENPYPDTISKNSLLNNQLLGSNITNSHTNNSLDGGSNKSENFNCSPPEGVPIYEWFPAVVCRLGDLLPPKISISSGACGAKTLGLDSEYGGIKDSFYTEKEQKEILECKGDVNKNGINDCIESKLSSGSLSLNSDSNKYYYNKYGKLKAEILDENGNIVKLDNNTYINFILDKIEAPKDKSKPFNEINEKIVYDSAKINEGSEKEISKYISFTNKNIKANAGIANYTFSSKNKDANIFFKAEINLKDKDDNVIKTLTSPQIEVKIRGDELFLNSSKIINDKGTVKIDDTGYSAKVSDAFNIFLSNVDSNKLKNLYPIINSSSTSEEKVILNLENISKSGNALDINYPLKVTILKDSNQLLEPLIINSGDLDTFEGLLAIKEAGVYDIEIIDNQGLKVNKQIVFLPEEPFELDIKLGSSIIENGGNITTNLVTILDKFGNIVSGKHLNLDINIGSNVLVFKENGKSDISYKLYEGYKAFRLQSTDSEINNTNKIRFTLKDSDGNIVKNSDGNKVIKDINIKTQYDIKLNISDQANNIKVGGEKTKFFIEVQDNKGNLLSDFNSRAYLIVPPIYGKTTNPYVDIINGKAEVEFITSIIAGENIPIEFQAEGVNNIFKKNITINPEIPIKVDIALSKNKMEANPGEFTSLAVDLKDRFGNVVFNDNSSNIELEILPEYNGIITTPNPIKTLNKGKTSFQIYGTEIPGQAFFKVKTNPDIKTNSFEMEGQRPFEASKLTPIPGMLNSSGSLTPIGQKIFKEEDGQFMSRFPKKELMLGNSNFKALNPLQRNKVETLWDDTNSITIFGVGENIGKIETFFFWNKDNIKNSKYNSLYTTLIGAPYGDVSKSGYLAGELVFDKNNRSLAVTSLLNNTFKYEDVISIMPEGGIKSIYSNSTLTQDISYNVGFENNQLYLGLFNESLNTFIGKILFNFDENMSLKSCIGESKDFNDCGINNEKTFILLKSLNPNYITFFKDGKLKLKNQFGKILLEINEKGEINRKGSINIELNKKNKNNYSIFNIKSGNEIIGIMGFKFFDPKIIFSRSDGQFNATKTSYKNSILGLIKTTSYGTRDNIGTDGIIKNIYYNDPFSDKKQLNDFSNENEYAYENFVNKGGLGWEGGNKTLLAFAAGSSVGEATRDNISFSLINIGDPVISLKKLKKKLPGKSIDRSFDSSIGKLINKNYDVEGYKVFDYNKDSKDDILIIKKDNSLRLLENKDIHGDFLDKGNLALIPDLGNKELIQVGDFSGDGYGDIFFVNKIGRPFLLKNEKKDFIRKDLKNVFNLSGSIVQSRSFDMNNDNIDDIITLDDAGEINIFYGNTSYNFSKNTIGSSYGIKLTNAIRNDLAYIYFDGLTQLDQSGIPSKDIEINENKIDNIIFLDIPYKTASGTIETKKEKQDNLLNLIPNLNSPEIKGGIDKTNSKLLNFTNKNKNYISYTGVGNPPKDTTFIKSEYSESVGIKVKKKYTDTNSGFIISGDLVKVDVSIKNTSGNIIKDLVYIDTIPNMFVLVKDSLKIKNTTAVEKNPPLGFDILVDNFSLAPNQELKLSYYIKTLAIKHSYMQVGLFEEGELGNDKYGDVLLKKNKENCSQNTKIYRSIGPKSYEKGIKTPNCKSGKIKLPSEIEDKNNNGVPDHIDYILKKESTDQDYYKKLKKYSKEKLSKKFLDDDGDGIPNSEDSAPNFGNNGNLFDLDEINNLTNDASEELDTFIDGLGCGFGGGGCFSLPLNWAPLAPGNDPVLFGKLIGDGLNVGEGLPVFSAMTWKMYGPVCGQSVWPVGALTMGCAGLGAGGWLGTNNPTNMFRLFITPTITGAIGEAICFGPPKIAGCAIPPTAGINSDCPIKAPIGGPFVPYGNCIVAAQKLDMCSNDGSDGDPGSIGEVQSSSSGYKGNIAGKTGFGVINGNCTYENKKKVTKAVDLNFVKDYIDFKKTGIKKTTLITEYDKVMEDLESYTNGGKAFINLDGGIAGDDMELSVEIDSESLLNGDFPDAMQIKMERTWGFPDFLMNWVTRQIEEIKTKLTDWPTIYIILPDFSGILDGWDDFLGGLGDAYETGKKERINEEKKLQLKIDSLKTKKGKLDCDGDDFGKCLALDSEITKNKFLQDGGISFAGIDKGVSGMKRGAGGIESVYKFLSNTPLIDIKQEVIYINIPWINGVDIEKTLLDWKLKKKQWENEIKRAGNEWSLGATCNQSDPIEKKKCEDQNSLNNKVSLEAQQLINSLERNIEILEGYKNLPKDLYRLIKTKEIYLEQIVCNLDNIAKMIGGRIGDNGTRFKAWIELYITIKAILKSWQLLIDVFTDYDAECHQCKNERHDSLYTQFKAIDLLIPKIPVIQFPKWPDIIIDLHNIKINLQIFMPELKFNFRPIVLPQLPNLYLPKLPNVNLKLPELPLLPELTLPVLPELPSLPNVELPNLPPPPTLPKLFSSLEAILDIIKLLVKVLCILKSSPLVPEWRAGDQIAFITERQGYLGFDFLDVALPQFSFPFVDAIKVTSYVNLEYDNEFMVELARQALSPINSVTNNMSNMFNVEFSDLDFSLYTPENVNVDISLEKFNEDINKNAFAIYASKRIMDLITYINKNKDTKVSSSEFISLVNKSLASKNIVSNPKYDEIRNLWSTVAEIKYSKEDKLIKKLQETNTEKFNLVKDMIKNEIRLNKELLRNINKINTSNIKKVNFENKSNIKEYNKTLEKYNAKFIKSAVDLIYSKDRKKEELKKAGDKLFSQVENGVSNFSKNYLKPKSKKLLSDLGNVNPPTGTTTACQIQANSKYRYNYKGLYILEGGENYRLFDYIDILNGNEETTIIDFDEDGDDDLLYMVNNKLYLKENLTKNKNKIYLNTAPTIVKSIDNKFYNGDIYYESINYFDKMGISDGFIDVKFNGSTNKEINNYRLEFYSIVDKWLNKENSLYTPIGIKKGVIDAFSDIDSITMPMEEANTHILRKNLAYISNVGNNIPGVELKTSSLIRLENNKITNLDKGTKVYSTNNSSFTIYYTLGETDKIKSKFVEKNQNVEFKKNIKIVKISGGDAYIKGLENITLSGININKYLGLPLIPGTKINADNEIPRDPNSFIKIKYYDNSEIILDFRTISNYNLYDLGIRSTNYNVRVEKNNDSYYGKIRSFSNGIFGTYSKSILSSPQKESDLLAPENNIRNIDIPIFQEKEIDLTPFIFENGGIKNIKDVFIDFDLSSDNSNDGKPKNDRDNDNPNNNIVVNRNEVEIKIKFGPYDKIVDKKIGITLVDENDNIGYKEVSFKVSAPSLLISKYENNLIEGNVNNDFNTIPVSFFRFRGGAILPLKDNLGNNKAISFDEGKFKFQLDNIIPGLKLEQNGTKVADINENTGKITTSSKVNVYPSNHINNKGEFPKIEIEKNGKIVYTQFIRLLDNSLINVVNDFSSLNELDKQGLYFKLINKTSYSYYKIPEGVLYNPGTLVIYKSSDSNKKALFTIFKDGRINTLNNNYKLVYSNYGSYIKLILKDNTTIVAELLLNIDGGYIIE
ncbi:hypothetical protein CSB08_00530 [Candidatus Gracilibacteria bacterium]|nr:MAG: hypothetical protein CSB08_00530 [Candidatus Gracilibacteria bacterium]